MSTAGHFCIRLVVSTRYIIGIFRKDGIDEIKKLLRCGLCDDLALFLRRRLRDYIVFEKIEKICF